MTASILYPSITIRLRRAPGNFRHLVRSFVATLTQIFCSTTRKFLKNRSARRDQNRPRIVKIGAILAIFEPFEVLLFGQNLDQKDEENPHATFWRIQLIVPGFYRNSSQTELSPGRLSKFFEKWRVQFSGIFGCYDVIM